jgi:hypothetical protein
MKSSLYSYLQADQSDARYSIWLIVSYSTYATPLEILGFEEILLSFLFFFPRQKPVTIEHDAIT